MHFDKLNLQYVEWHTYLTYETIHKKAFSKLQNNKLTLTTRIGSDSENAEVFLYQHKDRLNVMKVIPVTAFNKHHIQPEINISLQVSASAYFPKIYATGKCDFTVFKLSSKFTECKEAFWMIMESIQLDVKQFVTKFDFKFQHIVTIIHQVIEAIYELNSKFGILHNDLHVGNVMMNVEENNKIKVKLIDFGSACKFNSKFDAYSDLCTFLKSLQRHLSSQNNKNSKTISMFLTRLITHIELSDEAEEEYDLQTLQNVLVGLKQEIQL